MKKIAAGLVVIIIVAAVVFSFGYVPFRTDPDGRYVLYSQSSGWQNVVPGERTVDWRWQLLVPRNVEFYRFDEIERVIHVSLNETLPSGDLYAEYVPGSPDFTTAIEIDVVVTVPRASLAPLAAAGLRPDGLESWFDRVSAQVSQTAAVVIRQEAMRSGSAGERDLSSAVSDALQERLTERFPDLAIQSVVPRRVIVPDVELYETARDAYRAVEEATRDALTAAAVASAEGAARERRSVETFSQYGEILTQYPVLLEYLNIVAEHGGDPLSITVPLQ